MSKLIAFTDKITYVWYGNRKGIKTVQVKSQGSLFEPSLFIFIYSGFIMLSKYKPSITLC